MELAELTVGFFTSHTGHLFRIEGGGLCIDAELAEAKPLAGGRRKSREPFSILFRGPLTPVLPQQVCHVTGKGVEPMDLFLVPLGPDGTGMEYEAIFG